ncbi:MAG: hypothetical protein IK078_05415 [Lachnospiraceae bacterium]|nr:hypothetical protein [Lachnospiraceae bacterium]
MTDREWIRKKTVLSGSTELLKLGGKIREVIENEYMSLYADETVELVCKDHEIDANFFKVADELEEIASELNEKLDYFMVESFAEDESESKFSSGFVKNYVGWYLEQTVRLCFDKYENGGNRFWQDWNMTYRAKKRMSRLHPVEERILYLCWGLDQNGKKRNASEIAKLPEFKCDAEFITRVCKDLKGFLGEAKSDDAVQREIIRRCKEECSIAARKPECDK